MLFNEKVNLFFIIVIAICIVLLYLLNGIRRLFSNNILNAIYILIIIMLVILFVLMFLFNVLYDWVHGNKLFDVKNNGNGGYSISYQAGLSKDEFNRRYSINK